MRHEIRAILLGIFAVSGLLGCDPLMIATTVGGMGGLVLLEERTLESSYLDKKIQLEVHDEVYKHGLDQDNEIFVMVYESEVMLVGFVPEAENREKIQEITENIAGVQRIYNEMQAQTFKWSSYGYDRVLELNLSTRLSLEEDVHAVNYVIRVIGGVAYMIGLALTPRELERVRVVTESIGGIKGLLSRVKIKAPEIKADSSQNADEALTLEVLEGEEHIDMMPLPNVE